ncbi:MAG: flagellar biosynthesis protein FlhB [Deltaproteobacteria bacterium]|nr:flagellar biosynthesis protein FlhB [Deltaproteobacteria bacterium]
MADKSEQTEQPTPKKIQDARKKGQVMKSREVSTAFALTVIFIYLSFNIGHIGDIIEEKMVYFFSNASAIELTRAGTLNVLYDIIYTVLFAILPLIIIIFLSSIASNLAQVGFILTFEPLIPDFAKINPITGIQRFFSFQSVNEFLKSFVKFFIIILVAYFSAIGYLHKLFTLQYADAEENMIFIMKLLSKVFFNIIVVMIILSIIDFFIQKWQYTKSLMMSKQEVKDEMRQYEGNPQVKNKLRKMQREISRRKILKEVKGAHVVITNPTHFAVALKYDNKKHKAPIVAAKGADNMAILIKKIAADNEIPVIENKYIARSLYEICEPGDYIPDALYKAVAEILAHLYSTNLKFKKIWSMNNNG